MDDTKIMLATKKDMCKEGTLYKPQKDSMILYIKAVTADF